MALPISIPNTFANANAAIPLSQLDNNFTTVANAINGIGNGSESLSNVSITGGSVANVVLSSSNANVTGGSISNVSFSDANVADVLLTNRNRELVTIDANGAANTINYDVNTQQVLLYQGNATANVTLNLRGNGSATLDSVMETNSSVTVAFGMTSNANAYYVSLVQIDGSNVTPKWQGGAPTGGTANSTELYVINAIKTAANTYTVFGSVTAFE
jgi:hypothetical protein